VCVCVCVHTYVYTIDQHFHLESSAGASVCGWDGAVGEGAGGACMPPSVEKVHEIVDQGYKIVDQPCLAGHVRWRLLFHCCISHPSGCLHASSSSPSSPSSFPSSRALLHLAFVRHAATKSLETLLKYSIQ
jgi:hypothetical protein